MQAEFVDMIRKREAQKRLPELDRQLGARTRPGASRRERALPPGVPGAAPGARQDARSRAAQPRSGHLRGATPRTSGFSRAAPAPSRPESDRTRPAARRAKPCRVAAGELRRPHALHPARVRRAARQSLDRHRVHPRAPLLPVQRPLRRDARLRAGRADRPARRGDLREPGELRGARRDRRAADLAPAASSTSNGSSSARTARPSSRRLVAKSLDPESPQQGTVWIVEDITDKRRDADERRAAAARAGGDPRHRVDRHRVHQGPAHRALQPALRGDVRLRAGRARGQADRDALHRHLGARESRRGLRDARARRDLAPRRAAPAQGRHHVLEPGRRPRGRSARSAQGLGVDRRGRHRAPARGGGPAAAGSRAPRDRGARAARARRAGADPRQRHGRHRLRAQPHDPALQPLFEQMFGDGPGELVGAEHRRCCCFAADGERPTRLATSRRAPGETHRPRSALYRRRDGIDASAAAARQGASTPASPSRNGSGVYDDVTAEHAARESLRGLARRAGARGRRAHGRAARRPRRARSTSPTTTRSPGCPTAGCWKTA